MNRSRALLADRFDPVCSSLLGGVPHGFFGHQGEGHQYGYGGHGDVADIARTRQHAASTIGSGGVLAAPHQVHSPDVITVDQAWPDDAEGRPCADGVVTNRPGIILAIVTADCAPILLFDKAAGVIGAAHAGWRGAHSGVLENTIDAMEAIGAQRDRICAAVGPTVAQSSYEVDDSFRAQFTGDHMRFFSPGDPARPGHWQFDLPAYAVSRLVGAGVGQVEDLGLDTYELEAHYYSYRRATHRAEPNYGRQISLIGLA